ncbi:hypothetical protein E2562_004371 [Oryza meyeriana var. granulata]|uniref:Uncharacterized protein n=1 Tax=Oryza meyeriana var. granulata TaxID=110450 RepID=A0A6G1CZR2_9ORYZ|nr:hypothetical protein E2562_004371 [Oryza meyeriana var. granulata]
MSTGNGPIGFRIAPARPHGEWRSRSLTPLGGEAGGLIAGDGADGQLPSATEYTVFAATSFFHWGPRCRRRPRLQEEEGDTTATGGDGGRGGARQGMLTFQPSELGVVEVREGVGGLRQRKRWWSMMPATVAGERGMRVAATWV